MLIVLFIAVDRANINNAKRHLNETLELTAGTFEKTLSDREGLLLEKLRLLSGDFAFKQAFATRDFATILSVLDNHRARVSSDVMMVLSFPKGETIANTLDQQHKKSQFPFPDLIDRAMKSKTGAVSTITSIDEKVFQLVVLPLFTPRPSAWLVIGFALDNSFAISLQESTHSQVSLLRKIEGGSWSAFSSTLPPALQQVVIYQLISQPVDSRVSVAMDMLGEEYLSLSIPLDEINSHGYIAVLQRSLDKALEPYMVLRSMFLVVFSLGLLVAVVAAIVISQRVSKPISALADAVGRVAQGDYQATIDIPRYDELGQLSHAFNKMQEGLAERGKIVSLLGKVVSPAIAEELINKGIVLGGEEREVTILFSDVRNFTSLCEDRTPQEILSLLNKYLSEVNKVIDDHGGVVDKYVGDAVMALFGAPVKNDDDPERAVLAAVAMSKSLIGLNRYWSESGGPQLAIGVGVNTAKVVAGNVGSEHRLNYTVIGDGVNLASRLEGITKQYKVDIVVSDSTRAQCPNMVFRELDRVKVKGKKRPVSIFQPLGLKSELSDVHLMTLESYHGALGLFREKSWQEARQIFEELKKDAELQYLCHLYLQRIEYCLQNPPDDGWDGTITLTEK